MSLRAIYGQDLKEAEVPFLALVEADLASLSLWDYKTEMRFGCLEQARAAHEECKAAKEALEAAYTGPELVRMRREVLSLCTGELK